MYDKFNDFINSFKLRSITQNDLYSSGVKLSYKQYVLQTNILLKFEQEMG